MLLTKSKYIQGVQCIKQLWLSSKDKTPHDIDPFQEFIFKQGEMIGEYARNMYPNGILVSENFSFIEKINFTKELVKNKQTIFEGSFLFDQCFCMVDILTPYKNGWELIEIKSSSGVKPVHIHDLSFQVYILRSLGINVLKSSIGYLNTEYVRNQILDINKLFKIHDLYNEVQLNNLQTQQNILKFKKVLLEELPNIPIGPYCNSPYACQFKSRCWSGISSPSVFDVVDLPIQRKFEYFFSNKIQIDNLEVSDFNHVKQKRQIACELESLDFVNLSKLRSFIKGVSGPISFLDFESFQMPIPPFDGLSPYESIPFMFSVHVLDNNHLIDNQFIASPNVDPRLEVIKSLLSLLPANGSILVFNKSSELNILDRLILYAPSYSEQILSLKYRLVDLQLPFKHQWLYMRAFNGSCSIKSILPAIDPSYSYDALEVSSGRLINMFYKQYLKSSDKTIVDKLKAYVKLDTYSMVVIYKFISRIIG